MKNIKSLKQQIMTVFSLALVAMTIAMCAPQQSLANGKRQAGTSRNIAPPRVGARAQSGGKTVPNGCVGRPKGGKFGPTTHKGVWVWDDTIPGYIWM